MRTEILKVNQESLDRAGTIIREGGLVAFPTETVYGLGADALCPDAVKKIFEAKGRPGDNPLIVHIASAETLHEIVREIPPEAELLLKRFTPGPLTLVLKRNANIPDEVTAGLDTVGVRIPFHPAARAFINAAGRPIAAPSANRSGSPSPTTAQHVLADLEGKVEIILDGGPCSVGVESTVLSLAGSVPMLLRPGGVTLEQLKSVLPDIQVHKSVLNQGMVDKAASPGMKYKHYSPSARVVIAKELETARRVYNKAAQEGLNTWLLASDTQIKAMPETDSTVLYSQQHPEQAAQRLFALLREADVLGKELVVVVWDNQEGLGLSVTNRLLRASAFTVLSGHGEIDACGRKIVY